MASTIFYQGRVISEPGAYSKVDASSLDQVGLAASGIVAIIGTAEGGIPVSALTSIEDFIRIKKPRQGKTTFRSGDLREAIPIAFNPSKDEDITAGAQEVIAMKVNPATQSEVTLGNASGDAVKFTSADYGAFCDQINVTIANGDTQGKQVVVTFEDSLQAVDDLGGDAIFKLKYVAPSGVRDGWEAMTAQIDAGGVVKTLGSLDSLGLPVTNALAGDGAIEVVSSDAGDTAIDVIVHGLDATSGLPVTETLTLNGTTAAPGTQLFKAGSVFGIHCADYASLAGTVTLQPSGGGVAILTLTSAASSSGMLAKADTYVASGKLSLVASGASTDEVIVAGKSTTGTAQSEKVTLNGAAAVLTAGDYSEITEVVLGDVAVGLTITVTATATQSVPATHSTVQKIADFYNGKNSGASGFIATIVTSKTAYAATKLDVTVAAADCFSPAEPSFYADLYAIIDWVNASSQLISAEAVSGAKGGAPSNTTSPAFLSGGSEGLADADDYQDALNWLKQVRVNTIVPLTADPAIAAAVDAHNAFMGGEGRNERDGVVGIMNSGQTGLATKAEIKAQIVNLNTRHMRACAQSVDRFNTSNVRETLNPMFGAVAIAGMQAGSPVGTALTSKFINILGFNQDSSWNPIDDSEEMIQAGLVFVRNEDGRGRKIVRNVTTHLSSENLAFQEAHVNEAVNYSVYNFRLTMESAVGKPGFAGTINATQGLALPKLNSLIKAGALTRWRNLDIELTADVLEVAVEMAPIISINFVPTTVHLVTQSQAAA